MILYTCPDIRSQSAGIRILYRHVAILNRNGIAAAVLHINPGFVRDDLPSVPVRYVVSDSGIKAGDIVVIPEGGASAMLKAVAPPFAVRRIIISLSWSYVYRGVPLGMDWRAAGVERVITHSPFVADFLSWAMRLPTHVVNWGIRPDLYFPQAKIAQVCYITRKQGAMNELKNILFSRNPAFIERVQWMGLDDLTEEQYAAEVRRSSVFVNLSEAEALPCAMLEAMRSRTLVAGYDSVGGQHDLVGEGPRQNCIRAENLDYVTLAQKIEPVVQGILTGDLTPWTHVLDNAYSCSLAYTPEAEERSVLDVWRQILCVTDIPQL